jgi:hypothetical protein
MTVEFGEKLMKIHELHAELDHILKEMDTYIGYAVEVREGDTTRIGHIGYIDDETGRVLVEFGLPSASDYNKKFYTYQDFVIGKIIVESP